MRTKLSIIGAGGHSRVVVDSLNSVKDDYQISIFDEITKEPGKLLNKFPIKILNNITIAIGKSDIFKFN